MGNLTLASTKMSNSPGSNRLNIDRCINSSLSALTLIFHDKPTQENKQRCKDLNKQRNKAYEEDERKHLENKLDELVWRVVNELSDKGKSNAAAKVKKADGTRVENTEGLLSEWRQYFEKLLKNQITNSNIGPLPADEDLSIKTGNITQAEIRTAIKQLESGKSPGCDTSITADALKYGGEQLEEILYHICDALYTKRIPPKQWITNIILPLPKRRETCMR